MQLGITIPLQKYLNLPKQSYGEPEDLFFAGKSTGSFYQQMNRDICSPSGFDVYGEPQEFFRKDMVRIGIISHFDKKAILDLRIHSHYEN